MTLAPERLATASDTHRDPRGLVLVPHVPESTYREYLDGLNMHPTARESRWRQYNDVVDRWPTLTAWMDEPLATRLGRLRGQTVRTASDPVAYRARPYLYYASLTGRLPLPWDFLIAVEFDSILDLCDRVGTSLSKERYEQLLAAAVEREWTTSNATQALTYVLPRLLMRHADPRLLDHLDAEHFVDFRAAVKAFARDAPEECRTAWRSEHRRDMRGASSAGFAAHAIVFQLGLVSDGPIRTRPSVKRIDPDLPPKVVAVMDAWLNACRASGSAKSTLRNFDLYLRWFGEWIVSELPSLDSLADLDRARMLDFIEHLAARKNTTTGDPIDAGSRRSCLGAVRKMLEESLEDGLGDVPTRPLILRRDIPAVPKRLPRNIPAPELAKIVEGIATLTDPHQRAALIIARWSGARRDEIGRLELDCLDQYADGNPRLRIPAGKTRKERSIPLHPDAADAIRELQAIRLGDRDRGVIDRVTERRTRYLFMRKGRHISRSHLFDKPLQRVCEYAGLLTVEGGKLVTAHRFRHTLGTELVEAGARFQTVMAVLGHDSADMTLTYAQVSDPTVKADYEKAVEAGSIAGPAAAAIRDKTLSQREVSWLQSNFFKTELELGACIRLPEEGPCECEIFFTCGKFFTTEEHAPRLRSRWHKEQRLIDDARERGWAREVERHEAVQRRIEALLSDLGQTLDGPQDEC
ncbi:MAG: site-specific integrase [Cellulomonadaceae bacterium]|nr:site-specific integrase [Cellulomonadaceae bacterium]